VHDLWQKVRKTFNGIQRVGNGFQASQWKTLGFIVTYMCAVCKTDIAFSTHQRFLNMGKLQCTSCFEHHFSNMGFSCLLWFTCHPSAFDAKYWNKFLSIQNRRQKLFNGRLDILKIDKNPLIWSISYFNLGGHGVLFGGLSPPNPVATGLRQLLMGRWLEHDQKQQYIFKKRLQRKYVQAWQNWR